MKRLCAGLLVAASAFGAAAQDGSCLIISEVVDGTLSGGCPKWIEITNTGADPYTFPQGGLIVQMDGSSDLVVDVNMTGITIAAGQAFTINSTMSGMCTGAFGAIYGQQPSLQTMMAFGGGDDRYILTDTDDGSHLLDIYGELGVDGTGTIWEYTQGYAYRLPQYSSGSGGVFAPDQWFYGGVESLAGEEAEMLMVALTTPAIHAFDPCGPECLEPADSNCDGAVNAFDIDAFVMALTAPESWLAEFTCDYLCANDCNGDQEVNAFDIDAFVELLSGD